ncbi:MAG: efflux RND transporter periplasmic adaptor subunit, partial [Candidatus Eisenbacteria bacterium]|nr:efflux RND transporter periplasmic adaptor subunit [Candidatus Eisenbacteria bacterium]
GLKRAKANLAQAKAGRELARARLAQASLALERTVVTSPISGIVSTVTVEAGELVGPGKAIARVVDIGTVRVAVGIPERDVLAVRDRREFDLSFESVPGRSFRGTRTYLGVEPAERSLAYRLELEVDNSGNLIRPGMFATVTVVRETRRDAVVVPLFSVIPQQDSKIVFVEEDGLARERTVEIGLLMGRHLEDARVEITKGLVPGDRLILVGHRQVEDGDPVTVSEAPEALKKVMKW